MITKKLFTTLNILHIYAIFGFKTRPIQDTPLALKEIFKNDRRSALSSASHLGRHVPVIGNFMPEIYSYRSPTGRSILNFYSRGINGPYNGDKNLQTTQDLMDYLKGDSSTVNPLTYKSGTITDVLASLLSLNKTPSYRALRQLRKYNLKPGDLVNLIAHSGGVQRMANLSHLLELGLTSTNSSEPKSSHFKRILKTDKANIFSSIKQFNLRMLEEATFIPALYPKDNSKKLRCYYQSHLVEIMFAGTVPENQSLWNGNSFPNLIYILKVKLPRLCRGLLNVFYFY